MSKPQREIKVEIVESKNPINLSHIAFSIANKIKKEGFRDDGQRKVH